MNTLRISANSALLSLQQVQGVAIATYDTLTGPKAIAIYRKIILTAIATAAFFYALGMAARNVWEALKGWCDEYEMKCRAEHQEPEIIEVLEETIDSVIVLGQRVCGSAFRRVLFSKLFAAAAQFRSWQAVLQYRLRAIASPAHWQAVRKVVACRSFG